MTATRVFHRLCIVMAGIALIVAILASGPATAEPGLGGPFRLIDQDGRTVSNEDVKGHPFLILFGFTHCADADLTTVSKVSQLLTELGSDAPMGVLFVTVDPERDTPQQLKNFLAAFDVRIRGLTGAPASVAKVLDAYHVYRNKVPLDGGEYAVEHTTTVYLVDKEGRPEPFDIDREDASLDLRRHL